MTDVFYEDLAKTRQQIHQHPEVSEDEHETTIFLKGYLRKLGIEPLNYPLKTGLIAEIGSGHPIIALRADIDALPIQENTGLSYASENGAMHACGHDFHQTSLLGAAQILKEREAELKGTVRLIFQPAEENFQGAYQIIEAGGIDGVSAIIGYHNNPHLKPGQIGLREGTIRTFDPKIREDVIARFEKVVQATADQFGAQAEIVWGNSPFVTYNDLTLTPLIFENSKAFAEVIETLPSTGGEDFATYQKAIPGVFAFIGSNGDDDAADWHHDDFLVKDEALPAAVNYYVENALFLLDYFKDNH